MVCAQNFLEVEMKVKIVLAVLGTVVVGGVNKLVTTSPRFREFWAMCQKT